MPESDGVKQRFTDAQIARFDKDASLYEIALTEARRSLDSQTTELSNLRTRAVQFLGFVGSATGFMVGASKLSGHHAGGFVFAVGVATSLSFITVVAVAVLLTPWTTRLWNQVEVERLLAYWVEVDVPKTNRGVMLRDLALELDKFRVGNEPVLSRVRWIYLTVICAGALQLAAWAVLVWHVPK